MLLNFEYTEKGSQPIMKILYSKPINDYLI